MERSSEARRMRLHTWIFCGVLIVFGVLAVSVAYSAYKQLRGIP